MQAVHAARRFPVILRLLAEGRLHLTAVRLLAPHMHDEDHLALLGGAIHKSRREIVALLARWFPSPDVASSVRKLPTAPGAAPAASEVAPQPETSAVSTPRPESMPPASAAPTPTRGPVPVAQPSVLAPLSADRYRLQVTLGEAAHEDLRCVQDLMRREIPDGDPSAIVARGLRLLREEAQRKAFSATTKPRAGGSTKPGSRDIPAHVERAVWLRDEGQCAFEGAKARCSERSVPRVPSRAALGRGRATVRREHRPSLSSPQRLRSSGLLRPDPGGDGTPGWGFVPERIIRLGGDGHSRRMSYFARSLTSRYRNSWPS